MAALLESWLSRADSLTDADRDKVGGGAFVVFSGALASCTPLHEFGYGLSYTTFEVSDLILDKTPISRSGQVRASMKVTKPDPREARGGVRSHRPVRRELLERDPDEVVHPHRPLIRGRSSSRRPFEPQRPFELVETRDRRIDWCSNVVRL